MKKLTILFTLILCIFQMQFVMAQSCPAPIINSFTPNTGFIGSTVTITGANFDATPANNQVFFGATQATVLTASFGTITVTVPVGATTALVSVKNNCNKTAYSKVPFNGIFCPTPLTSTTYQNVAFTLSAKGAYNMQCYDLDLDGKPDVISGGVSAGGFTIARNISTPGSLSFSRFDINCPAPSQQTFADFDGDGKLDIVYASNGPLYAIRNLSTPGSLSFGSVISLGGSGGYQIAAGDFNNDGKIDFVYEAGGYLRTYMNTSSGVGSISFSVNTAVYVTYRCTGIQCADVDGDGITDILGTQGDGNRAVTLRNTTTALSGTFTFESPEFWNSGGQYPYRCQIADFDKDGKIDLTTCNYNGATNTAIYRNISTVGDIAFATTVNLVAPVNNYRIQVGDVNGDGLPDIVTKSLGVNVFSVYPNTSSAPGVVTFGPRIDYSSSTQAEVSGIVIGDLDGDYVPDIATSGISSNTIRFHRNTSSQVDNIPPTASCKNIIVALDPSGNATVTANMINNGSSDACGLAPLQINGSVSVTFTCANIGDNTVTLTVTDLAGNVSTCTATVSVAPAAIVVAGQTTVCQGQTVTMTANLGDSYQWYNNGVAISGATSQTYVATVSGNYSVEVTNAGGCSGISSTTAVVVNNNPTVSTTPSGNTFLCAPTNTATLSASTSSIYQWIKNGVNISGATQQTYVATTAGTYEVQVIDLFGCSATSSPIIVSANSPEIDITGNAVSIADGDNSPSVADATDFGLTYPSVATTSVYTISNTGSNTLDVSSINISGVDAANYTVSGISLPTTIGAGSSVTFSVTFTGTAIAIYNAIVTVNNNDCNESVYDFAVTSEISCAAPAFASCPSTTEVNTTEGLCVADVTYSTIATGTPTPTLTYTINGATTASGSGDGSGSTFNKGNSTVTVTATNSCGTATCSFEVNVIDAQAPIAICKPITVQLDAIGNVSITAADVNDGSTDNCGIASLSIDKSNFTCADVTPSVGSLSLPSTVVRGFAGRTVTFNNINVNGTGSNIVTVAPGSVVTVSTNWNSAYTSSYCPGCIQQFYIGVKNLAIDCMYSGNTAGNCSGSGNISFTAPTTPGVYVVQAESSLQYSCTGTAAGMSDSRTDALAFIVVATQVTLTVTDVNGNVSTCTSTVTVEDHIAPVAICKSITVQSDANGQTSITAADVNDGSNDACGIASLAIDKSTFDCSNVGANTVTLTVTDVNGNISTCTSIVTVEDHIAPVAVCKSITIQLDATGNASITSTDLNDGSNDACGIASIAIEKSTFDCSNVGANTVTLTVTDINGNVSTCTSIVTVQDNIAPVISCPANIFVQAERNDCSPIVNWENPVASDNCTYTVTSSHNSGDRFPVGTTTVTYTVVDASGNTATCSFEVTVTPDPLVVTSISAITYIGGNNVSCKGKNDGEATVVVEGGCLPYSYFWSNGQTNATATGLTAGTYTVNITDANGTTISSVITLTEPTQLVVDAGVNQTVYYGYNPSACANLNGTATGGIPSYTYSWSDGSTITSITVCPSITTSYNLTVTDVNGCVANDVVTVCAIDVRCDKGGKAIVYYEGGKVLVCHVPGGDITKRETICISPSAVSDHLAHGDKLGICGVNASCITEDVRELVEENTPDEITISNEMKVLAFPNPFNNTTTISFNSTEDERITVKVYNIEGALVSDLFDEDVKAGEIRRDVVFNGSELPSGMYFAKVTTSGGKVIVRKLMLNK